MPLRYLFALLYLLHTLLASWVVYAERDRELASVYDLYFGFGPLTENVAREGRYAARYTESASIPDGIVWRAHRMPLVPLFLAATAQLSTSVLAAYFIKNLLFAAPLWLALYLVYSRTPRVPRWARAGLFAFALSMPPLLNAAYPLDVEEGYAISLIALLTAGLLFLPAAVLRTHTRRSLWLSLGVGVLLALLYLSKSSLLVLSLALAGLYGLKARRLRAGVLPVAVLGVAILGWGLFTLSATGRFATSSSWDGWNFYKGNNPHAFELYPPYDLDVLDQQGWTRPSTPSQDEWIISAHYFERGWDYVREHPGKAASLVLRRAFVLLLEVRNSPTLPGEARIASKLQALAVGYMVVFRVLFLACLVAATGLLIRGSSANRFAALAFLALLAAYCAPYAVGFAYERHVMPLVWPAVFFALWLGQWRGEKRETPSATTYPTVQGQAVDA